MQFLNNRGAWDIELFQMSAIAASFLERNRILVRAITILLSSVREDKAMLFLLFSC